MLRWMLFAYLYRGQNDIRREARQSFTASLPNDLKSIEGQLKKAD
jgi:hypothetical protein